MGNVNFNSVLVADFGESLKSILTSFIYTDVSNALRTRLIDPINMYLKYNQGMTSDPAGFQSSAKLINYADAYENLVYKINLIIDFIK